MSRYYQMQVKILEPVPDRIPAIQRAAELEWDFEEWFDTDSLRIMPTDYRRTISSEAYGNLCGGETPDEFAQRLARAIWVANGGYCEVRVYAMDLDNIPTDDCSLNEDDYAEWLAQEKGKSDDC